MSRCISSRILHTDFTECAPSFGAFVAAATVKAVFRGDARETKVEWQSKTKTATEDLFLGEHTERGDNFDAEIESLTGGNTEVSEEPRSSIGERVVAKRA